MKNENRFSEKEIKRMAKCAKDLKKRLEKTGTKVDSRELRFFNYLIEVCESETYNEAA